MRSYVFDDPPDVTGVCDFVGAGIFGEPHDFGPYIGMGIVNSDIELIAGVLFHDFDYQCGTAEVSAYTADPRWITRGVLYNVFAHGFLHLQLRGLLTRQSERNKPAVSLWRKLGADEYRIRRMRADNEDGIVFFLHRNDWLKSKFGPRLVGIDPDSILTGANGPGLMDEPDEELH